MSVTQNKAVMSLCRSWTLGRLWLFLYTDFRIHKSWYIILFTSRGG